MFNHLHARGLYTSEAIILFEQSASVTFSLNIAELCGLRLAWWNYSYLHIYRKTEFVHLTTS